MPVFIDILIKYVDGNNTDEKNIKWNKQIEIEKQDNVLNYQRNGKDHKNKWDDNQQQE